MKPIHHAPVRLFVPEGFSGWWCERCEKPVTLPEELGSPARCPKCHKPTAVWIPESQTPEGGGPRTEYVRTRPTKERAAEWFEQMRLAANGEVQSPESQDQGSEDWQSQL